LTWVYEKSQSVQVSYKPADVRDFYLFLDRAIDYAHALDYALDYALDRALYHALDLYYTLEPTAHALDRALSLARAIDRDRALVRAIDLTRALDRAIEASDKNTPELKLKLETLKFQLPNYKDWQSLEQWWQAQGNHWIANLRSAMIEYRNIGHDWQFTDAQKIKLQQYYDANKLLADCLNSDCYVTKNTRQYVEATMLLPLGEIEKVNSEFGIRSSENG
ncbi:MAG: signal transduction protein, partial [Cyanobacteria bacterium P01_F01_bin.86]